MDTKKLKDGRYYWVRRPRSESGDHRNPTVHVPHLEPMLWDADKQAFFQAGCGVGGQGIGHAITALQTVGDIIAPHGHSGRVPGVLFAVSQDGGKTALARLGDVNEALHTLDMLHKHQSGAGYAVVALKRRKRKTPKRP
jgi:hypothetical protein